MRKKAIIETQQRKKRKNYMKNTRWHLKALALLMALLLFLCSYATAAGAAGTGANPTQAQRDFIARVGALASADMERSGVLASLTVAQAILESGWGTSALTKKANALFGIKADSRWKGRVYSKTTQECYNGVTFVKETALFRAYDSWEHSVSDHSAFLLSSSRYAAVIGERNYKKACAAIQKAGYATDPGYAEKLTRLIETYGLTAYDGGIAAGETTKGNAGNLRPILKMVAKAVRCGVKKGVRSD